MLGNDCKASDMVTFTSAGSERILIDARDFVMYGDRLPDPDALQKSDSVIPKRNGDLAVPAAETLECHGGARRHVSHGQSSIRDAPAIVRLFHPLFIDVVRR